MAAWNRRRRRAARAAEAAREAARAAVREAECISLQVAFAVKGSAAANVQLQVPERRECSWILTKSGNKEVLLSVCEVDSR